MLFFYENKGFMTIYNTLLWDSMNVIASLTYFLIVIFVTNFTMFYGELYKANFFSNPN